MIQTVNPTTAASIVKVRHFMPHIKVSYIAVIVKQGATYNAIIPAIPGCVATSTSLGEVKDLIQNGLQFHLEGMVEDGEQLPEAPGAVSPTLLQEAEEACIVHTSCV